jgi:hypothetical protein
MMESDRRFAYVKRSSKYEKIDFSQIAVNESFILCEPDGTPVGHYVAASWPYEQRGIETIQVVECKK